MRLHARTQHAARSTLHAARSCLAAPSLAHHPPLPRVRLGVHGRMNLGRMECGRAHERPTWTGWKPSRDASASTAGYDDMESQPIQPQ